MSIIQVNTGLPIGGTTGQVLVKNSNSDLDVKWGSAAGGAGDVTGPAGATSGNLASFADATGKVLSDSGKKPSDFLAVGATAADSTKLNGQNASYYQVAGNELAALQLLADTAGFVKKTGDGAYSIDAGTYQASGNELTALQALADTAGFVKKTGDGTYAIDTTTYVTSAIIDDTAYGAGWDGDTTHAPTKNAVYDKISTMGGGVSLLDVYPVGAIYLSVVSTSPATLFGGTWSALAAGRVLVGIDAGDTDFDTVEETGGSKTVQSSAQTFSGTAMGTHQHAAKSAGTPAGTVASIAASGATAVKIGTSGASAEPSGHTHGAPAFTGTAMATHQHDAITAGTPAGTNTPGAATSVVQPYLVCYMWKRTA